MKVLIIDGPGVHPRSCARALGSAFHQAGHGVIVHPVDVKRLGWFPRFRLARRAEQVLKTHEPDVVHVFSSEPWIADAFLGHGVSVVHSGFDRRSKADWMIAPSQKALDRMNENLAPMDRAASCLPYAVEIGDEPTLPGDFVLAHVDRRDKAARKWLKAAARKHKDIPVRFEGKPVDAKFVVSLSSREDFWPAGVAEAMAEGRAVVASWNGAAAEYVLEGATGFLSAPGDVESLSHHLRYLWDQPDEALRLGLAGRDEARGIFGGGELVRTLLRWYLRAGVSRLAV